MKRLAKPQGLRKTALLSQKWIAPRRDSGNDGGIRRDTERADGMRRANSPNQSGLGSYKILPFRAASLPSGQNNSGFLTKKPMR